MRGVLKIILIINIFIFSLSAENKIMTLDTNMKQLDSKLSCLGQKTLEDKIECLKERTEKAINKNKNRVQLGVFSKEEDAKKKVEKYNKEKEKISNLKTSKAYYFLKKIEGHKKLKDGKYYVVFVIQKGVSAKKLQRKINKGGLFNSIVSNDKIIIDIDNEILKAKEKNRVDISIADKRVKILKEKANCYTKYQENKKLNQFMECLNKEVVTGIQIYAFSSKKTCKKIAKNYKNAQCLDKKIKNKTYHYVVIAVESSNVKEKNKIKKKFDAFQVKKPEILIK